MGGNIETYANHEVTTGNKACVLRFYVANMGGDHLVLGYPWFTAHDPQLDWAAGTLPVDVEI